MPMTVEQLAQAEANANAFEDLKEMQRTQPALYQAICDYGAALCNGDTNRAFKHAGDIAAHVLALASGLKVDV